MNHFSSFGILLKKDDKQDDTPTPTNTFVDEDLPTAHRAAAKGDVRLLSSAIKKDARLLEQRSHGGLSPLAQAVQCQQLKSVKQLIMMGADIDAQDNIGRTCLSVAAYQGWHEGVVCLLHHGAKRNICDNAGRSPLHAATYHSDTNTLAILLNSLSINEVNQPDNEIMTAVHWAAFHDRPDHLMQLIQRKADVYARDIDGKLPLHWAAQNGSFQCVHRLISLPDGLASVNDLDHSGKSPAHYAAAAGSANILTILSHCDNIDLEIEDPDERTPLHWAAAMGHAKAAETLLKVGANPFVTDMDGYTPLEYARQADDPECMKMMEAHFCKSGRVSYTGLPASGKSTGLPKEEKYRYRRLDDPSPPPEYKIDLPNIKVLPPTATQTLTKTTKTKTTTNRTCPMTSKSERDPPRMYSASTDTDNLDYPVPHVHRPTHNHNNNHHYHHQQYNQPRNQHHHHPDHHHQQQKQDTPQHSKEEKEQKVFSIGDHSDIFAKLVGSTFLAGAQAPILSVDENLEGEHAETFSPRDLAKLHQAKDEGDEWAQRSAQRPVSTKEKERVELKVMTCQNTPDLNRVSVDSFRSIPPTAIPRATVTTDRQKNKSPLQSYLAELGNKKKSLALPPVNKGNDVTTPRSTDLWRSMLQSTAPAPVKQVVTSQPPPHDFMTDNNAETRILTRMLRSTLGKGNHQPSSHFHALHGTGDKEIAKRATGQHPSIAAILQQKRARDEKPQATAPTSAAFNTKHSRIPSTRLDATVTKTNQQARNQETSLREPNNPRAIYARSPSGILLNDREKYLDEDVTKPVEPKPLLSIHLPNSGRGKQGEKIVELPKVHKKSKSKSKNKKAKHGLEKLSNRYGGVGGGGGGGGGGGLVAGGEGVISRGSVLVNSEVHSGAENVIKMPPIHKESVPKNLRRVRVDKSVQQQVAYY